ncbi:32774_t:CDS:2 [Gigaspora margarita]|uniref:32774_t:CDS:1 n=1 Tax=Gigaspora margarita TaxID=4874 RepID=A0ABM8W3Z3_GIGMA|nr:32774_t:CDS:2 [Gigaspora margarita]
MAIPTRQQKKQLKEKETACHEEEKITEQTFSSNNPYVEAKGEEEENDKTLERDRADMKGDYMSQSSESDLEEIITAEKKLEQKQEMLTKNVPEQMDEDDFITVIHKKKKFRGRNRRADSSIENQASYNKNSSKITILAGNKEIKFERIMESFNGRVINASCTYGLSVFQIVNVYAPPTMQERSAFFKSWSPQIKESKINIIGGDFNLNIDLRKTQGPHEEHGDIAIKDNNKVWKFGPLLVKTEIKFTKTVIKSAYWKLDIKSLESESLREEIFGVMSKAKSVKVPDYVANKMLGTSEGF